MDLLKQKQLRTVLFAGRLQFVQEALDNLFTFPPQSCNPWVCPYGSWYSHRVNVNKAFQCLWYQSYLCLSLSKYFHSLPDIVSIKEQPTVLNAFGLKKRKKKQQLVSWLLEKILVKFYPTVIFYWKGIGWGNHLANSGKVQAAKARGPSLWKSSLDFPKSY